MRCCYSSPSFRLSAAAYGNEHSVGAAIARSGIKREDLFIASKLNNLDHGYVEDLEDFDKTMKGLELDYLDLYLIHWLISLCIVIIDKKQMLGLGKHLKSSTLLGKFVPLVLVIFFLTLLRSY
ncbi:hypothetical protein GMA43_05800 [Turicibacter sanguinis]|uniref:aldo/keto reductase n=1 Tax=Turicibacter sanguinis TaxID=154288 RepID=UPI001308F18A|nr:hypothetical protein [Turicibacter sanguinis]MTH10241.1 hypothetical protein [Turicibacter sanguinis]MTH12922.1 hypothetical protein [Turicibacter sanguinis]MTH19961.1 hypothetical protein [Turicibacter sanguinis]MTH40998.1 hypothetical protein [Turicibacter sanguinis]